jgi:hypothetical protein
MMMTICLIFWRATVKSFETGLDCVVFGKVGDDEAVGVEFTVGFKVPVFGTTCMVGKLLVAPQAERKRIETSKKEWISVFIPLLGYIIK